VSGTAGTRVWLRKADNDLLNIENNLRADDGRAMAAAARRVREVVGRLLEA